MAREVGITAAAQHFHVYAKSIREWRAREHEFRWMVDGRGGGPMPEREERQEEEGGRDASPIAADLEYAGEILVFGTCPQ
jgi:hypothetical protein